MKIFQIHGSLVPKKLLCDFYRRVRLSIDSAQCVVAWHPRGAVYGYVMNNLIERLKLILF